MNETDELVELCVRALAMQMSSAPGAELHMTRRCILALTDENNERPSPVRTVRYKAPRPVEGGSVLGRTYSTMAERGLLAARSARALRDRHGFSPDLIIGHSGWGETLFLKEIWPQARLLPVCWFYPCSGQPMRLPSPMRAPIGLWPTHLLW